MTDNSNKPSLTLSYEQANLINDLRILMSRAAYLTRFYIVESVTGVGNREATYNEILRIPLEMNKLIRAAVPDFKGDIAPITFTYLAGMKSVIDGMTSKDEAKASESIQNLYDISNQNAKYLAQLSPYWDENTWRDLFYRYNRDVVAEVLAILTGDYNQALDIFEGLMQTALEISDYFAEGLVHLLPESQNEISLAYFNMVKDFRQIGMEWAYLTRFYMVAKIVGLGDERDVTQRFYRLILRIKEKIELILGTEIANNFSNSMMLYVIKFEGLIDAILSEDQASIENNLDAVNQFDNQLSAFLSSVNPFWDEEKWIGIFNAFVEQLIVQSNNLNKKEYVEAINNFEKLLYATLAISDYFALGLYQYTR
ncbi:MAG TPA: hypothetical protein VFC96_05575 [Anaerovoracaceae bacterium]|nr:hypothetical protein [Anaerovoracaceae bacterium]